MNAITASSPAPCVWFCGLSGAGKSTVAQEVYRQLTAHGVPAMVLDGDMLRKGLCSNLGFSDADRHENLRRVREVAKIVSCAGVIPLIACITPFDDDRQKARELLSENGFILVYMNTPLEECQRRDTKGLYKLAKKGQLTNFTGIDSPFELPTSADIIIKDINPVDAATKILSAAPLFNWINQSENYAYGNKATFLRETDFAASVLRNEARALSVMADGLDASFIAAVDCLHNISGRIAVTGVGKSGLVGRKVAATLASIGSPAYFIHACEASHGDLGMLKAEDALLAFSKSGNTGELLPILEYAARRAIPVVAVTSRKDSPLGRHAKHLLLFPLLPEADPMDCAPTTSTTLEMALGDALALVLMRKRGITPEEFHRLHPGGALGRKLLTVGEIMHTGGEMPLVRQETLMCEALMQMTGKGFGVVGVVDGEGKLAGIITDGDLRRHMDAALFSKQASRVMHPLPVTVEEGALVTAALRTMNDNKITTLFVNQDGLPVGIINVHDCLRAGVQ